MAENQTSCIGTEPISHTHNATCRLIPEKRHFCNQIREQIAYELNSSVRSVQTKNGEALRVVKEEGEKLQLP